MSLKDVILIMGLLMFCTDCHSKTPVRRCSGDLPFPLNVQVNDCQEMPCAVMNGTTTQMEVQFVAVKDDTYNIETEVLISVLGIKIPYDLPAENGAVCKNLMFGAYCPLYAEEDVTFHLDLPINNNLIESNVKTEVRLRASDGDILACYIVDMKVSR